MKQIKKESMNNILLCDTALTNSHVYSVDFDGNESKPSGYR